MTRRACVIVSLVLLVGCGTHPSTIAEDLPGRVILISIDTLRADHLSLYGYDRPTAPFLGRLAAEGIVFDSFSQNGGGTLPSHMTMMTSLHPRTHRVFPRNGRTLNPAFDTLAEVLSRRGFATAGFTDAGWMLGKFGFKDGFDRFDDSGGGFEVIMPKAKQWLNSHSSGPFFLFLHTYDVHSQSERLPYDCPEPFVSRFVSSLQSDFDGCRDGRCATEYLRWLNQQTAEGQSAADLVSAADLEFIMGLYDGCITYVDHQIESLMSHLQRLGIYDSSLIVITSDHGESFLEHERFLHQQGLYDTITRIPLIIKMPKMRHAGSRVPHLSATVDLLPTILDVLSIPPPEQTQGHSLLPTFRDNVSVQDEVYIFQAVRTLEWKWIRPRQELFRPRDDPYETNNIRAQQPDTVRALDQALQHALDWTAAARLSGPGDGSPVGLTGGELERLRALGYAEDAE